MRNNPTKERLAPIPVRYFLKPIYILRFCLSEPKQYKQCQTQFSDYFQADWIWHMLWFYLINPHVVQNKTNLKWKVLSAFIEKLRWIYNYFVLSLSQLYSCKRKSDSKASSMYYLPIIINIDYVLHFPKLSLSFALCPKVGVMCELCVPNCNRIADIFAWSQSLTPSF